MMQTAPSCLHLPLLLAIDAANSTHRAQKLLYPVAKLLAAQSSEPIPLVVLAVQPRPLYQRVHLGAVPVIGSYANAPRSTAVTVKTDGDRAVIEPEAVNPQELTRQIRSGLPADVSAAVEVTQGRPAATILRYAQKIQAGLVAVDGQTGSGARELLLGSVSAVVARYAPCHVLVARGSEDPQELGWKHVLLVVNGSQATGQAIAMTQQLAPMGIQRVTILCTQPPLNTHYLFVPFGTPTPSWQFNQSLQEAQRERSQQLVRQAEAALSLPGLEVQTLVQTSDPGSLICQVAAQQRADVIVLGSDTGRQIAPNRRSPFRHVRLTATGDYVIHHAPCPVLLCRSTPSDPASRSLPLFSTKPRTTRIPRTS